MWRETDQGCEIVYKSVGVVGNRRSVMLRNIPDGVRENVSWQDLYWCRSLENFYNLDESELRLEAVVIFLKMDIDSWGDLEKVF